MNVIVKYHQIDVDAFRVVGFYVEPFSIKHEFLDGAEWDPTTETVDEAPPLKVRRVSVVVVGGVGVIGVVVGVVATCCHTVSAARVRVRV